jgi:Cys-rich protein (TIGR01571 family)
MVSVVAPSTLAAGYTFTAQVDGKEFVVTVPEGGVTEGQSFQVPYPAGITSAAGKKDDLGAPTGRWRDGCFDCFDVFCKLLFWQGWCCSPFLYGQLAQRLGLNYCGQPGGGSNTCKTISMTFVIYYCLCLIGLGFFVLPFFFVWIIILGMNTRFNYRKKYEIPATCFNCCDGMLDDCMCAWLCECCTGIQMARHTHPEAQYPYQCCTETGLPANAPGIV